VSNFFFKDRDGQPPLPHELFKGLKIRTIQTIGELDEYEEANISKGLYWLKQKRKDPQVYDFWLALHKKLFGEVWSWAGKVRSHELSNPDFLRPHEIWSSLYQLEENLNLWISNSSFSPQEIAARFHERLETIHPFPNGNGRWGRILTEHICRYQQYEIPTWGLIYRGNIILRRESYISALICARREKDFSPLINIMYS
jgi:Fic-DOC domain mobile mystery protein B